VKNIVLLLLIVVMGACQSGLTGDKLPNKLPETYFTTDTIIRFGNDRYNTNVLIQWNADDADGVITGYEFTFDSVLSEQTIWHYTTKNDSVFPMQIPLGNDSLNFVFSVRAIDDKNGKDPSPARLWYPIKNAPPTVQFVFKSNSGNPLAGGNPSFSLGPIRYSWNADDLDGINNIASIQFCLNDTSGIPVSIDPKYTSATFRPNVSNVEIIPGASINPITQKLTGLIINDSNIFYIRALDKSGAKSAWAASNKIKISIPSARLLLVSSNNTVSISQVSFFKSQIQNLGISFDYLPLFDKTNGQFQYLSADAKTQGQIFNQYDAIVWFADDLEQSMSFAQATTSDFVSKGGHIFFSSFSPGSAPIQSVSYSFSPIDSLIPSKTGYTQLLTDTSTLVPLISGYPNLKYQQFLSGGRYSKYIAGTTALYHANFLLRNNSNFSTSLIQNNAPVMGIKTNSTTGSKFVISTLELNQLNGSNNINSLFSKILKTEFGL
jgi:hypothetical protein